MISKLNFILDYRSLDTLIECQIDALLNLAPKDQIETWDEIELVYSITVSISIQTLKWHDQYKHSRSWHASGIIFVLAIFH